MALSVARKNELKQMGLPSDEETRQRMRLFLLNSGMLPAEFADAVGYSMTTIHSYLNHNYDRHHPTDDNTLALRAAAVQYMDRHAFYEEFKLAGTHHSTQSFEEVRRAAFNALRRGTAYLVDGPPGTEKTWSLRQIEREVREKKLGRMVYVYARAKHSPLTFLRECCASAGVPSRGNIDQLIRKLRFFLGEGRTLFAVDEAQHLDHAGLEVLRQLLDLPPHFGVILAGSHDLTQRLSHWQMEQWRSRLRKTIYLNGPTPTECRDILRAELGPLPDSTCDSIIDRCKASAVRVAMKAGKPTQQSFDYISARLLFGALESAQESVAARTATPIQKGAAA